MRPLVFIALVLAAACSRPAPKNSYTLHGQVLSIEARRKTLTIRHGAIAGLMPAMTMPYTVHDGQLLSGLAPGDVIDATLVVESNDAFLSRIDKTGHTALETVPDAAPAAPAVTVLLPGDRAPDAAFVTQDGRKIRFDAFKGAPVVMTFIYTRCPLPTFCPLMDRHFAEMQKPLAADPSLARVRLVTVSFDPEVDTPRVLKQHGKSLNADFTRWTFLTGTRADIDPFAAKFGVFVSRAPNDPRDITHNLRTVILDADERLVKTYTGNDWTPAQVLADLRGVARESGAGIRGS